MLKPFKHLIIILALLAAATPWTMQAVPEETGPSGRILRFTILYDNYLHK